MTQEQEREGTNRREQAEPNAAEVNKGERKGTMNVNESTRRNKGTKGAEDNKRKKENPGAEENTGAEENKSSRREQKE